MSSTLSSPGIGSGLDVKSIVTQLTAIERQPLYKLQGTASTLQGKMSAIGQLQSLVSGLRDAMTPLSKPDNFKQMQASSSDAGAVSVSAAASAVAGSYAMTVSTLAAGQTLVSASGQFTASTDTVGTGTLTLRLGTWSNDLSTFTPKSGSSDVAITIGPGENTLAGIRDKINASNAGVTASIVTDASGARLSLRSSATGLENGFRVTATDDDGNHADAAGLSRLAYDPAGAVNQMTRAQAAANTVATINGISVSSANETLANVIEGLTIKVAKVPTGTVNLTVSQNTDVVKNQVNAFVNAYNQLNKFLNDATRYDPATKQGALFQGDSSIVSLQTQLRSLISQNSMASLQYQTLSSMGIQLQKDGSLKVEATKLDEALKQLPEVSNAFSRTDAGQPALTGFGRRFLDWADGLLSATGALPSRTKSLQTQLSRNQKDQDAVLARVAMTEKRLQQQYAALDGTVSKYNALNSYVSQFAQALAKSGGSRE